MKKILFSFIILLFVASFSQAEERPNILFIMADDLGWMDLHCQGNNAVKTPHLDQLAKDGIRFTDAYAAAPVCSPTRAATITGLSPAELHLTNHTGNQKRFQPDGKLIAAPMVNHLALKYVTFAERLKEDGYATAFLGKWHLSGLGKGEAEFEPTQQGFDINIGGCAYGGPPTFFDPYRIPNLTDRKEGEYLPDRLADETIAFMEKNQKKPFIACLWSYTVHWPMEAPESYLAKYKDHKGPGLNDYRYGAMIEAMDHAIGKILAALDKLNLRKNTLVVFTSDNGGFGGVADNRPLRMAKGHLYEGGIRVPFIARWPQVIHAGRISDEPIISMDLYPTFLEAAKVKPDPDLKLAGKSLIPVFKGEKTLKRKAIYFHYPNYAWHKSNRLGGAIRQGDYKLIERFDDGSVELYNLKHDLSEKKDLAKEKPELADRMVRELQSWRKRIDAKMPIKP